ncbi:MAG TPA: YIP1 family protein [Candidatus Polarisedimenticolaceae bacterium]|nr:YIP1 family protein [Candidatus Polarisedimenticolaceae bacterium]
MGPLARLLGVFTAPGKTFASIARFPGRDWLLPAGLLLIVSLVGAVVVAPKIDVDAAVEHFLQKMDERMPDMGAEQRAEMERRVRQQYEAGTHGPWRFIGVFFVTVPLFLVPLIYHGVAAAFGKQTTYGRVLTAYAFVQGVQIVKSLLFIAVASTKSSIHLDSMTTVVKSNLAAFLDPETTSAFVRSVASNLDVFEIWALVLGILALSRVTKFKPAGAAAVVAGLWAIYVICAGGMTALSAAFGGA